MAHLNKVFQAGVALFNYRTKNSNGQVTTANLINVFEFHKNKFQNYSELEKFDMWSSILQKWFIAYLRKLVKPRGNLSQRKVNKLDFGEEYQWIYDDLVKTLRRFVNDLKNSKYAFIRGDVAYEYLSKIKEFAYDRFIYLLNNQVDVARKDGGKITVKYQVPHRPQEWYESREIPGYPGEYYRIDRPYSVRYHRYHSRAVILD